MAFSDDDEEILSEVVSEYYFYDAKDQPVSFAELPVQWSNGERSDDNKSTIYLRGNTDNGLQRLHKQVKAWKYEFLKKKPELSVLSKDNNWIKLQKPRKSFESKIRTILITVHCLYFFNRKPKASSKALRHHLCEVFSLYEVRPSENDLIDHLDFIREAVKRDETLQASKFLASLLNGRHGRRAFDQNAEDTMKPSFIVDDTVFNYKGDKLITKEAEDSVSESDDDGDDDVSDRVCAICDNGGDLTCCDGRCLRSFHATVKSAKLANSSCKSLGLHEDELKGSQSFLCLNCSHEQHQCFVCGNLGSSDKSSGAEVFCCSSATCGHFYHPHCVAKLLEDESDTEAHNLEEKIAGGEPFTCPAHKCHRCKKEEDEKVKALQFAVCRRCPRSYHRKCLPSKIVFYNEDHDGDVARAWNNLLPKSRALIYCLKHKMDHTVGTAVRNIKFPKIDHGLKKVAVNEDVVILDHTSAERSVGKSPSFVRLGDSSRKRAEMSFGPDGVKKQRVSVTYKKPIQKNVPTEAETDSREDHIMVDKDEQTRINNENDNISSVDANSRDRISTLIKDAAASLKHNMVERHYGIATSDPYVGVANNQPYNKTGKLDTAQQRYNREAYIDESRKYETGSLSQRTGYVRGGHDWHYSSRYRLADADPSSSCDRFGTSAMNRYAPRLDELNHTWMKYRGMWVYDHVLGTMHPSSLGPGPTCTSTRHHTITRTSTPFHTTNHRAAG